jgi:hypothetical protein
VLAYFHKGRREAKLFCCKKMQKRCLATYTKEDVKLKHFDENGVKRCRNVLTSVFTKEDVMLHYFDRKRCKKIQKKCRKLKKGARLFSQRST